MTEPKSYRPLTQNQIKTLEANGCTAEDWSRILVADGFDPSFVRNTDLLGQVRIGNLTGKVKSVLLFTLLYTGYIVYIGGDVLKVHRFFLPIIGPAAMLITFSIWLIIRNRDYRTRLMILFFISIPALWLTYSLPKKFVSGFHYTEIMLQKRMRTTAHDLLASDTTQFSVAMSTIGIFGYELLGHHIIDMLGLTDSTIAKHSEPPIEGMQTTWKEQKHNSRYLLSRVPDYILFSTQTKPSAYAERALFTNNDFFYYYYIQFIPRPQGQHLYF